MRQRATPASHSRAYAACSTSGDPAPSGPASSHTPSLSASASAPVRHEKWIQQHTQGQQSFLFACPITLSLCRALNMAALCWKQVDPVGILKDRCELHLPMTYLVLYGFLDHALCGLALVGISKDHDFGHLGLSFPIGGDLGLRQHWPRPKGSGQLLFLLQDLQVSTSMHVWY